MQMAQEKPGQTLQATVPSSSRRILPLVDVEKAQTLE